MPDFFDPGHGFLSSVDEIAITIAALVLFTVLGGLTEYVGDARGGTILGALIGFIVVLLLWGPPLFAEEWHYAVVVAVPIVVLVYLYRGRGE